jgi:hypothetical protein
LVCQEGREVKRERDNERQRKNEESIDKTKRHAGDVTVLTPQLLGVR